MRLKVLTENERLSHLDGLRGIAAVVVVAFHILSALAPGFVPDQGGNAAIIAYTPLAVLWNGPFAVSVFFVLSGFVVANAALRRNDPLWIDVAVRYLRLAIPATFSVIVAWLLLIMFPTAARDLQEMTGSRWLSWTYQGVIPGLFDAVYNGTFGIFLTGGSHFNNVLWTLRPELLGSIVCFLICLLKAPSARIVAGAGFILLSIATARYEYSCFVLGLYLREAWAAGLGPWRFPVVALVVGLLIGSQSGDAALRLGLDRIPAPFEIGNKDGLLYPIAATLVVYGCLYWTFAARLLSGRLCRFLGEISFPLYLLHVPLIYTVFAYACRAAHGSSILLLLCVAGLMVLLVALSYLVQKSVERPLLAALSALRQYLRAVSNRAAAIFQG